MNTDLRPRARTRTLLAPALFLAACASNQDHTSTHSSVAYTPAVHWTYEGAAGPANWGTLDPAYSAAVNGKAQSPIDIATAATVRAELPTLRFQSAPVPLNILNNGHTVEVKCAKGNSLQFGDTTYALDQFHFHSPSEHMIDSKHAAIEMHMVHKAPDGHAAVVGLMIQPGAENANFASIWGNLPVKESPEHEVAGASVDPGKLLPADRSYYFYEGSLTTPPCSEGLRWFVLKTPVEMSADQIAAFQKVHKGNNRPVQPHHARIILKSP